MDKKQKETTKKKDIGIILDFPGKKKTTDKKYVRSDKKSFFGIKANGNVFIGSLVIILSLIIATVVVGKPIEGWFANTQKWMSNNFGWFFIMAINFFLIFALIIGGGKFGKLRIGGENAESDFSTTAWFAMLFSAGMGIGLLFYSVAEPIMHFGGTPFNDGADKIAAAKTAMGVTFLHWGLHAWAVYAIVGLALAYFTFNKKLPLTIRSIFYPVLGEKIYGRWGDLIDIISVSATMFGLATSLGVGVQQANAGLAYVFGVDFSNEWQIGLIVFITFLATMSLVLGLDKGIRRLSEWNVRLAMALLIFVLLAGPTLFILKSFGQNIGFYLSNLLSMSTFTESYKGISEASHWQSGWTITYWAWWISWSPFVGIFIARISKGRTIREFVLGVLLVPTVVTFLWMTVFGGSALHQELMGNHDISEAVNENVATAIYHLLENFPFTKAACILTILLVGSFFVTSSDSGSMVVDMLTSGGKLDSPVGQKVFWASTEGAVTIVLLVGGGLTALQTATLLTALPFAVVILIMCYNLYKVLNHDYNKIEYLKKRERQKKLTAKIVSDVEDRLED
ncbi:BCCT family transporter [Halosquirtibacter xylanolyticus]|uniref:BCCT family transporter n=1 Tax=Halosquirtibacter xylanolyticus TaxID=3374599 RepID=UPI0037484571|nr:BCCT family transporter [Prolixibacteraceae bacterium]